jgi:hypothetical protein
MIKTLLNSVSLIMLVFLALLSDKAQAQITYLRPYGHIGILLTPPGDEELGSSRFISTVEMNPLNYGFGLQPFFRTFRDSSTLKIGFDFGWSRIFYSDVVIKDPSVSISGHTTVDTWTNIKKENSFRTHGIIEFYPENRSIFIQAGIGLNVVFRTYSGKNTNYIRPSFMAALGFSLFKSKKVSVPIIVRFDNQYATDYGLLISANIMSGVNIKF